MEIENKSDKNKVPSKSVDFEGIVSGDNEAFCWDVSKETFTRVTGTEPDDYDQSFFNEGTYRLYPNQLMPCSPGERPVVKVKITSERIESDNQQNLDTGFLP